MEIGDEILVESESGATSASVSVWRPYFEHVYAPTCGPTAVLTLRILNRFAPETNAVKVTVADVAAEVGVAPRRARRAIETLVKRDLARFGDDGRLIVPLHVPLVSERIAASLPPLAADAHDRHVRVRAMTELAKQSNTGHLPIKERLRHTTGSQPRPLSR